MRSAIPCLLAGFLASCCAFYADTHVQATRVQAIVYGLDDRLDLYQAEQPFARLGRENAIALIASEKLELQENTAYAIRSPTYGDLQSLCSGERFSEQIAAASCSGVLVSPEIVATAGHCLGVAADGRPDCRNNLYVRGYALTKPGAPIAVAGEDVFECAQVLARVKSSSDSACHFDIALLKLSHTASTTAPIVLRDRPVEANEPVAVIGFPAGLPLKIDQGARVVDAREALADSFTLSSDTFAVSSGSGVFDGSGNLVGVFAKGRRDYENDGFCQRVRHEPEFDAAGYEQATHIAIVHRLLTAVQRGELPEEVDLFPGDKGCTVAAMRESTNYDSVASVPAANEQAGRRESQRANSCNLGRSGRNEWHGAIALACLMCVIGAFRRST
ncbi:trypsin-like serine peptidase [Myxococcota bacterium]